MKTPPWPKKVKVSRRKYLFAVSLDYVWFGSQNFSCRLRTDKIREKKNLGTSTTPRPFYSHLSTNWDGHQSSCHRKGKIVPGTPYYTKFEIIQNLKSLGPSFGEHDMQLSSLASKNRNSVCSATLATRTAHQVGTNIKPHLRSNSLQDYLFQSKWSRNVLWNKMRSKL